MKACKKSMAATVTAGRVVVQAGIDSGGPDKIDGVEKMCSSLCGADDVAEDTAGAAAVELAGLGPEDPVADDAALTFAGITDAECPTACAVAVDQLIDRGDGIQDIFNYIMSHMSAYANKFCESLLSSNNVAVKNNLPSTVVNSKERCSAAQGYPGLSKSSYYGKCKDVTYCGPWGENNRKVNMQRQAKMWKF